MLPSGLRRLLTMTDEQKRACHEMAERYERRCEMIWGDMLLELSLALNLDEIEILEYLSESGTQ